MYTAKQKIDDEITELKHSIVNSHKQYSRVSTCLGSPSTLQTQHEIVQLPLPPWAVIRHSEVEGLQRLIVKC